MSFTLFKGDCLEQLHRINDNSIDSIVTDPPYGLSFMGKKWDYDVPSVEVWKECFRVLKPGGHLVSFSSARTYHRMVVNVEDAGFEIRDQIMWVYGSGFPKNHNIGKKVEGWEGWGTALKPSHEPIVLARKPLSESSIAANVLEWGTGGLNIDASRVPSSEPITINTFDNGAKPFGDAVGEPYTSRQSEGRFPANFIHDGIEEDWSRYFYCAKANKKERNAAGENNHPTVKPIALMSYLINLITPPDGVVLDPFMGSGSTGVASIQEGHWFFGCEMDEDYLQIAEHRLSNETNQETKRTNQ